MVLQILLVIFTTTQVLKLAEYRVAYQREMNQVFREQIYDGELDDNESIFKIFNVYQFQAHFRKIQSLFSDLNDKTIIWVQ